MALIMFAAIMICAIVGVVDGDTLTARCEGEQIKIRVAEIDAPEKKQPWGSASKQQLSEICFNSMAEIRPTKYDRYRRLIARVSCNGKDVSEEQVKDGMAWVYDKYVSDRSLYILQEHAQAKHQGVWSDSSPVAPWLWRKQKTIRK